MLRINNGVIGEGYTCLHFYFTRFCVLQWKYSAFIIWKDVNFQKGKKMSSPSKQFGATVLTVIPSPFQSRPAGSLLGHALLLPRSPHALKPHSLKQSLVRSPLHLNHCVLARLQSESALSPGSNLHGDSKERRRFIRKLFPGSGSEKYWSVLKAPADKLWYYEHFALGQKLLLFLITWFEQEPAFRICPITQQPFIFPTAAAKISLISVLCCIFKDILWVYDTVKQHSTPCFLSFSLSLSFLHMEIFLIHIYKMLMIKKPSGEAKKLRIPNIRIFLSALRQILYNGNELLIFSTLRVMGLLLLYGLCIL